MLQAGDKAPDFTLKTEKGENISLKQFRGKSPIVIYFYPRDNTPGCTQEACSFRDALPQFQKLAVPVLGVSCDSVESHLKFKQSYALNFPLLSDEDRSMSTAYGVYKEKNMYGKKVMGIERTTFVIGKDGRIACVFNKVKVEGHVEQVLEALKKLEQ
jgi:peroxiredoxin Q/BCP